MELGDYLRVLRRRWLIIVLAGLVSGGAAFGYSHSRTPLYDTAARLVVTGQTTGLNDEIALRSVAVSRAVTYASYAETRPAVEAAMKAAGYNLRGSRPSVVAEADGSTPFLTVRVTDTDPQRAADVANAYVGSFLRVVAQLDGTERAITNLLTVVDPAPVPDHPTSPNPLRDAGVGLLLGLILGVAAAFVRESLDKVYRDADVLEDKTELPVLGVVPQELSKVAVPTLSHPMSSRAEAYRTVRTNIQFSGPESSLKRIVVTSAAPGDGKTVVSSNLAVAFSRTGQSVVLIDADLRRPQVAASFGLDQNAPGLSELLTRTVDLQSVLQLVPDSGVAVLPAGRRVTNPSELLGSPRMAAVLDELGQLFDVVILDCPPVLPVSDPLVLAVNATGVVVVVRLGVTSSDGLARALSSLRKLDVTMLGLVANGAVAGDDSAYTHGSKYAYGRQPDRQTGRRSRAGR